MAAVAPIYDYDFRMLTAVVSESSWRQLLFWLGPPGVLTPHTPAVAAICLQW